VVSAVKFGTVFGGKKGEEHCGREDICPLRPHDWRVYGDMIGEICEPVRSPIHVTRSVRLSGGQKVMTSRF
jgi:hypothetical protein